MAATAFVGGRHFYARTASARRLPLLHSRDLLLARGRRSATVLPQSAFCSCAATIRGCCLRTAVAGSTTATVMQ
ncbi:hypothetical protein GW17_00058516 [Ensete ventricosum]|nr:hypothetical protein GW17_00058516 [Ensete ventricosum]